MGNDKNEKKIKKQKDWILHYLKEVDSILAQLDEDLPEKKKKKLHKNLKDAKWSISYKIKDVINMGGNVDDIMCNISDKQMEYVKELFPDGANEEVIKARKIIDNIILRMDKVKKLKQKMTFDPNDDIKIKVKNDLFRAYEFIGTYIMALEDKSLRSFYNEYWQYTRDYENTKDKYFTKEEQEIIATGLECSREYNEYFKEKHKFALGILDKIEETGEKMYNESLERLEGTKLKQARLWAENLYKDVFPDVVKLSNPDKEYSEEELRKESIEMSKRYIKYLSSEEEQKELRELKNKYEIEADRILSGLREEGKETKENVNNIFAKIILNRIDKALSDIEKDKEVIVFDMMMKDIGFERAFFINAYDNDKIIDRRKEYLTSYTLEELGF